MPRKNNRRQQPHRRSRLHRRLATMDHGSQYHPSADPPTIKSQPWNNIVVTILISLTTEPVNITIKTVGEQLYKQLGFDQNPGLEFCILRSSGWSFDVRSFSVQLSSLARYSTVGHIAILEDTCGKNHWARFGWKYSSSNSTLPFRSSSDPDADKIVLNVKASEAGTMLLHFQLKWRGRTLSAPESSTSATILDSLPPSAVSSVDHDLRKLLSLLQDKLVL